MRLFAHSVVRMTLLLAAYQFGVQYDISPSDMSTHESSALAVVFFMFSIGTIIYTDFMVFMITRKQKRKHTDLAF